MMKLKHTESVEVNTPLDYNHGDISDENIAAS